MNQIIIDEGNVQSVTKVSLDVFSKIKEEDH